MNDVDELKRYVEAHARGQRIGGLQALLERIHSDDGDGDGTWVGEWCRTAEDLESRGRHREAGRHYAMARFPYVDGPARQSALDRCVRSVDRWRSGRGDIERLDVDVDGGRVRCWASGLSHDDRRPLLVIMGGIVTIKEQWVPMLANMNRLGMAGLVTEMPGTGENTLRYGPESWRMLPSLLDAVADRADVTRTYAIALSFSGHMALQAALTEPRLKGVITVGAPIGAFFTDTDWQRRLPPITVHTLAHMTGISPAGIVGGLGDWALSAEQLRALDIPLCYTACTRDEIIPPADLRLLKDHVSRLETVEHDDVHGAPGHIRETQLWTVASLFRSRGVRNLSSGLLSVLASGERVRARLARIR